MRPTGTRAEHTEVLRMTIDYHGFSCCTCKHLIEGALDSFHLKQIHLMGLVLEHGAGVEASGIL